MADKLYTVHKVDGFFHVEPIEGIIYDRQIMLEFEEIGKKHLRGGETGLYNVQMMQRTESGATVQGPTCLGGIRCNSQELSLVVSSLSWRGWKEKRQHS